MFTISIRDLGKDLRRTSIASRQLRRDSGQQDAVFFRSAWQVSEAVQPIVSDPLPYYFNPETWSRYPDLFNHDAQADYDHIKPINGGGRLPDNLVKMCADHHRLYHFLERFEKELKRIARKTLKGRTPSIEGADREWIVRFIFDLEYPDKLPREMLGSAPLHLGAFLSFHMGRMKQFAADCLRHPEFVRLPRFWRAVIGWFGAPPTADCEKLLKAVVGSNLEKKGHRRLALLLLWTRSEIPSKDLLRLTQRYSELQRSSVQYRGSPPLPVKLVATSQRPPAESVANLIAAVARQPGESGMRGPALMDAVQDLFGATVDPDWIRKKVEKISDPCLKALVCGGRERVRAGLMSLLAAGTGHSTKDWADWTMSAARANQQQFRSDLIQWRSGTGPFGPVLTELRGRVFLAREIQTWPDECREDLCDLLQPPVTTNEPHAWPDPVIASTDLTFRSPPRDPVQRRILERLQVHLNLDLDSEEPDWLPRYDKKSCRVTEALTGICKTDVSEKLKRKPYCGEPIVRKYKGNLYVHRQWLAENLLPTIHAQKGED